MEEKMKEERSVIKENKSGRELEKTKTKRKGKGKRKAK